MTEQGEMSREPMVEPLTRREHEILRLLAEGLSAAEIAARLTLAVSSVKWYLQQIYGKLGVNNKRQALARAGALGLLGAGGPAPAAQPSPKHNLPLQVTRFFGREAEIAQLEARLAEHRLVTLTGSGGVGKTRLSLRTAEALMPHFIDGVWLVELASLSDPALVAQQVAASLGLRDEPGRPILETLLYFLRERQVLLVLDNCEHLLEACGRLADKLLRACPRVRLLASSREPLGIAGEAVFAVPSLSFPDPAHLPPVDQMTDYVAVNLFLDRARLVLPGYKVASHNAAALARICWRLDGIPLAIEMAAARVNILNADQLAAHLDDSFRVLTGGSRSALPRQQTLRATIDWSYQLLSDQERALFQRLSVFAGSANLEAIEAVCADVSLPAADAMERLASLVAKSLVLADRQPGEEPRYRLLVTVRQYAREKLRDAGDSMALHARHLAFFLELALEAESKLRAGGQVAWLNRLETEHDNLRAALEFSQDDLGLRLAGALQWFWVIRGHISEGRSALQAALAQPNASGRTPARATALYAAAHLGLRQGEYARPRAMVDESIEILRGAGPAGRPELPYALLVLGSLAQSRSDGEDSTIQVQAPIKFAESAALFREVGDKWGLGLALFLQATILDPYMRVEYGRRADRPAPPPGSHLPPIAWDDHSAERALCEESLSLFRELGDRWAQNAPLSYLARLAFYRGDRATGRALYEECFSINQELGSKPGMISNLERLGTDALAHDDLGLATTLYQESLALCEDLEFHFALVHLFNELAEIARRQADYAEAEKLFTKSLDVSQQLGHREDVANSLDGLGRVAWSRGDHVTARALQMEAFAIRREASHPVSLLQSIQSLAILAAAEHQPIQAARLFGAVEAFQRAVDYSYLPTWRAECERSIGALRKQLGEAQFQQTLAEGRAMTLEQTVAYALGGTAA